MAFLLAKKIGKLQSVLHSFVETDHEIFSTVIFSIPLIQEEQLSVSGERMCSDGNSENHFQIV